MPKKLRACFKDKLPSAKTADDKVKNLKLGYDRRGACGNRAIEFYDGVKAAREKQDGA